MNIALFKTVGNYAEMLDKIAVSTFIVLIFCIYQIIYHVSFFHSALSKYLMEFNLWGIKIPMSVFIISIVLAFISRSIKLHDRLSDLFKIRDKYDLFQILYPLAMGTTNKLSPNSLFEIKSKRKDLMNKCFYKYASSKDTNPLVDKHLITMAIDQLSWFWVVIESIFFLFVTSTVFIFVGQPVESLIFIIIANVLLLLCIPLLELCKGYTKDEVEAILNSQEAK